MNAVSGTGVGEEHRGEYRESQREGRVARAIEKQTAKLPSDMFLWAASGAIVGSLVLQMVGARRRQMSSLPSRLGQLSLFVGQWAPTFLLFGIYNKIVKVAGSDRSRAI